jgi:hypothetical protein
VAVVSVWGTEGRIRSRGIDALGARTAATAGAIA